jgi:hypothetical protein
MSLPRLRQRLRESGVRLRARAYARLTRYWNAGVRPEEEDLVERLFSNLVDGEVEAGTPLESLLARLPQDMVREIRRQIHVALESGASQADTCEGGALEGSERRGPLQARSAADGGGR